MKSICMYCGCARGSKHQIWCSWNDYDEENEGENIAWGYACNENVDTIVRITFKVMPLTKRDAEDLCQFLESNCAELVNFTIRPKENENGLVEKIFVECDEEFDLLSTILDAAYQTNINSDIDSWLRSRCYVIEGYENEYKNLFTELT